MSPTADDSGTTTPGGTRIADFEADTRAHRRLYWTTEPAELAATVAEHTEAAGALLTRAGDGSGADGGDLSDETAVRSALAESLLLKGRIELLALRDTDAARASLRRARETAAEAGDPLLEAAALAHSALLAEDRAVGGAEGEGSGEPAAALAAARALLTAAGTPAAGVLDWLDAVESERAVRDGEYARALRLVGRVAEARSRGEAHPVPEWLDWCTTARIGMLKGRVQLAAGLVSQARRTLLYAMGGVAGDDHGQRAQFYAGLAAVEAADDQGYEACGYACRALEHIEAGGDVMGVRATLTQYLHDTCVEDLYQSLALSPSEPAVPSDITQVGGPGGGGGGAPRI
ncbi:hypothetical protein ACFXG1_22810 [Streptomyces sp. NPDC059248]|uniref:hypothetical protein n=1 Tax=Streptomyces sp. NPDC059248 TaxID=3346791 RepID=UPI0036BAEDD1